MGGGGVDATAATLKGGKVMEMLAAGFALVLIIALFGGMAFGVEACCGTLTRVSRSVAKSFSRRQARICE